MAHEVQQPTVRMTDAEAEAAARKRKPWLWNAVPMAVDHSCLLMRRAAIHEARVAAGEDVDAG